MSKKQKKYLIAFFLIFVLFNLYNPVLGQRTKFKETLKINATVVAYDILSANEKDNTEVFFVRVDKIKKGKENSKYLIITRFHSEDDSG